MSYWLPLSNGMEMDNTSHELHGHEGTRPHPPYGFDLGLDPSTAGHTVYRYETHSPPRPIDPEGKQAASGGRAG